MEYSDITILYEDNHIIVVVKPPGILSQSDGTDKQDMLSLLKEYIKNKYQKPGNVYLGLVHRLDLNVGGIMVYAKTSKAASRLFEAMKDHDFSKEYFAVIEADLPVGESKILEDFLGKDENEKKALITNPEKGKYAKLEYEVIDNCKINNKSLSLVKINLMSGRFHQIRIQFASRGMPLFGDTKYGHRYRTNNRELGLFAYSLSFPHPVSKDTLSYSSNPTQNVFQQFGYFKSRELV